MTWMIIERPGVKLYKPYYQFAKRVIDLTLCVLLAPLAAITAIFIVIAIRLDSPGPIFFVQKRIGKGARVFNIIKFRTMYHNIDKSEHREFMKNYVNGQIKQDVAEKRVFKPFTDSQVTRIGRILRKTSLDELPQLINIAKGEMSFVGPRPNVCWEVEAYQSWHKERLEVLPGITGLAQVRGRSEITFDEIVKYDIEYIKKQGLKTDLLIMWQTFTSVLAGKGAH